MSKRAPRALTDDDVDRIIERLELRLAKHVGEQSLPVASKRSFLPIHAEQRARRMPSMRAGPARMPSGPTRANRQANAN